MPYLIYQALLWLLTSLGTVPLTTWMLQNIQKHPFLVNHSVYSQLYEPKMALFIVFLMLVYSFMFYLEGMGVAIINRHHTKQQAFDPWEVFKDSLQKMKHVSVKGWIALSIMALSCAPLLSHSLLAYRLSTYNYRLTAEALSTMRLPVMLLILVLFLMTLYSCFRWVYAFKHFSQRGILFTQALKMSITETGRGQLAKAIRFVMVYTGLFGLTLLLGYGLMVASQTVLTMPLPWYIKNSIVFILAMLSHVWSLLVFPLLVILTTCPHALFERPKNTNHPMKKYTKLLIALLTLAVFIAQYQVTSQLLRWDVAIAAHRGASADAPENTLASIQKAIDYGAEYVEIDVMLTKDGVAILNHDATFKRTTGLALAPKEVTYDFVKGLDVGSHFSDDFSGERVPTLEEALLLCKGRIRVLIDLKDSGNSSELVEAVLQTVEELSMVSECRIQSFNSTILKEVRLRNPDINLGQIIYLYSGNLNALDVDFYTIKTNILTRQFVNQAHAAGREVWVWTVNSELALREVFRFDIDGVITDYPVRAQAMRSLVRVQR